MTNKYLRTIYGVDKEGNAGSLQVDVYDILDAYPTKNPALDHLIKKALCPGQRGHKDLLTDLDDIIASAKRAKAMIVNKMACITEVTIDNIPDIKGADTTTEALQGRPALGYASSFSHRPTSFDSRMVYIVEGITEKTLAALEHKIAQVDTIPDYVQGPNDCPERSIVIRDNNAPHPAYDGRWHFTVAQAIAVLVNDQTKGTTNA